MKDAGYDYRKERLRKRISVVFGFQKETAVVRNFGRLCAEAILIQASTAITATAPAPTEARSCAGYAARRMARRSMGSSKARKSRRCGATLLPVLKGPRSVGPYRR